MVEAEQIENRGVNVGHVVAVFGRVKAELVRGAVDDAALDAAAGQRNCKSIGMMVAAVAALSAGRATEFGGDYDDRLVEQTAVLQVAE